MIVFSRREFSTAVSAWLFVASSSRPSISAAVKSDAPPSPSSITSVSPRGPEGAFQDAVYLEGVSMVLPAGLINTGKPTIIWTEELVLDGRYETGGAALMVVTRRLVVAEGTVVSTRGSDGFSFLEQNRATDGPSPGAPGAHGSPGKPGQNGGDIILLVDLVAGNITLDASGGDGGRGQTGGYGAVGQSGSAGAQCVAGSSGGAGGSPGAGGDGGAAGSAGSIRVEYGPSARREQFLVIAKAGNPGLAGKNGEPGSGGPGGPGGPPYTAPPMSTPNTCRPFC